MDFHRPVEAVIPGAVGRLLAALARVEVELPVTTLAGLAGVGRTRASGLLGELSGLGIVTRREVGRTVLVSLDRHNAAGRLVQCLENLRFEVLEELGRLAAEIDPVPVNLSAFGSFARGEADAESDIDILAVRPSVADDERWGPAVSQFAQRARMLTGNPVRVLEYDLDDVRRRARPRRSRIGHGFWDSVCRDAVTLVGSDLATLLKVEDESSR